MQPLNYTPKAIACLRQTMTRCSANSAEDLGVIVDMLERAEVFMLPDNGTLLDRTKPAPEVPGLTFKPPFPVVALEYQAPGNGDDDGAGYRLAAAPRRIALGFEVAPTPAMTKGGAGVISIAYYADPAIWAPISLAAFIPYDAQWSDQLPAMPHVERFRARGLIPRAVAAGRHMEMSYFPVWREVFAATCAERGFDTAVDYAVADFNDEASAYRDLCYTLACKNVRADRHAAPEALNRVRAKTGKPLLRDFHVLTLDRGEGLGGASVAGGGGPRPHLRRGHIRRLGVHRSSPIGGLPERITWVNAAMVRGRGAFVGKHYRVRPSDGVSA